jgi:putative SOS response-associated peptidase YedK
MCYSALVKREAKLLEARLGAITIRDQLDDYRRASTREPKKFPPLADRIYPGHYAPVVHERGGERVAELMRYNIDPPAYIKDPGKLTCFNARRDNLESAFWSDAFMVHHGILLLEAFYEWVEVPDLLKAGRVSIDDVASQFAKQAEARRARLEGQGKAWKPTPTETKDPRFRKIVIEFKAEQAGTGVDELFVPVVFTERPDPGSPGDLRKGFAIVTDAPPTEVAAAGHDRCPVFLTREFAYAWLKPTGRTAKEMLDLLDGRPRVTFHHVLDPLVA